MSYHYAVNDIYPALQGEGALAGTPMVLLRLHGCPVGCPFCDTKETWEADPAHKTATLAEALGTSVYWTELDAEALATYIGQNFPRLRWVLLTGGEPALQPLGELIAALHAHGFKVAVETSGTADGALNCAADWLCVSPKVGMPGGLTVLPEVVQAAHEIKFVIGKQGDLDRARSLVEKWSVNPSWQTISLQPMSTLERATQLCVETAMAWGWNVSIQMHKYLGLR